MRAADAAALAQVSHDTLVERAGTAVALAALTILGGPYGRRVVVIAGKGSNGADARVAARLLARRGVRVQVIEAAGAPPELAACDLIIDGAYGTGFHGSYDAPQPPAGVPVLAIDLPSGLDADSGAASGRAVRASHTVTFAAPKPGLLQGDGPEHSGRVTVVDIGVATVGARAALIDDADIAALPHRPARGHKWNAAVGVVAGSAGMEGAAILCSRGAMAGGAGMIRLGSPGHPAAAWPIEVVRASLPAESWAAAVLEATSKCRALAIGPGLGTNEATQQDIRTVIAQAPVPLVIDADALSALGDVAGAAKLLAQRSAPTVLTPHDGEYARLAGHAPSADRLASARELAEALGVIVLLKGQLTSVAQPAAATAAGQPDVLLSDAGVPALATAGSGDVLSGLIAAFLARGVPAHQAAALAAFVHGRAAALGPAAGLVAGDLPGLIGRVLSESR
jgi:NAD(P)H-hydrate epimerase